MQREGISLHTPTLAAFDVNSSKFGIPGPPKAKGPGDCPKLLRGQTNLYGVLQPPGGSDYVVIIGMNG